MTQSCGAVCCGAGTGEGKCASCLGLGKGYAYDDVCPTCGMQEQPACSDGWHKRWKEARAKRIQELETQRQGKLTSLESWAMRPYWDLRESADRLRQRTYLLIEVEKLFSASSLEQEGFLRRIREELEK